MMLNLLAHELFVSISVLGEAETADLQFRKCLTHPERKRTGYLNFHQPLIGQNELVAVIAL